MTKETRYNLIFLAIVVAILLPGAIILVRKKMRPDARRADLPDAVPRTIAFMDPQPTPPGMRRVAPPRTMQWLTATIRPKVGAHAITDLIDSDGLPLMSDDKTFQLAAVREESGATRLWLISWDPQDAEFFRAAHWSLASQAQIFDGSAKAFEQIAIPDPVRDELGENGLLKPPKTLAWREVEFAGTPTGTWRITANGSRQSDQLVFVPSFTNPAATKKYVNFP
jgi:hypothetical protein